MVSELLSSIFYGDDEETCIKAVKLIFPPDSPLCGRSSTAKVADIYQAMADVNYIKAMTQLVKNTTGIPRLTGVGPDSIIQYHPSYIFLKYAFILLQKTPDESRKRSDILELIFAIILHIEELARTNPREAKVVSVYFSEFFRYGLYEQLKMLKEGYPFVFSDFFSLNNIIHCNRLSLLTSLGVRLSDCINEDSADEWIKTANPEVLFEILELQERGEIVFKLDFERQHALALRAITADHSQLKAKVLSNIPDTTALWLRSLGDEGLSRIDPSKKFQPLENLKLIESLMPDPAEIKLPEPVLHQFSEIWDWVLISIITRQNLKKLLYIFLHHSPDALIQEKYKLMEKSIGNVGTIALDFLKEHQLENFLQFLPRLSVEQQSEVVKRVLPMFCIGLYRDAWPHIIPLLMANPDSTDFHSVLIKAICPEFILSLCEHGIPIQASVIELSMALSAYSNNIITLQGLAKLTGKRISIIQTDPTLKHVPDLAESDEEKPYIDEKVRTSRYGSNLTQSDFLQIKERLINYIALQITKTREKGFDLRSLLVEISDIRYLIAEASSAQGCFQSFSERKWEMHPRSRHLSCTTPVYGGPQYKPYAVAQARLLKNLDWSCKEGQIAFSHIQTECSPINGSELHLIDYGFTAKTILGCHFGWRTPGSHEVISHTLDIAEAYLKEVLTTFKPGMDILGASDFTALFLCKLAISHWWFMQGTPIRRGSSFAGEVIAASMAKVFDIQLTWSEMPDLCAITRPLPEQIEKYLKISRLRPAQQTHFTEVNCTAGAGAGCRSSTVIATPFAEEHVLGGTSADGTMKSETLSCSVAP